MLNLQVSSLLKVLTIIDNGVCEDGRSWVRCSALSFFDEEEQIMTLTAFGHYADMIIVYTPFPYSHIHIFFP